MEAHQRVNTWRWPAISLVRPMENPKVRQANVGTSVKLVTTKNVVQKNRRPSEDERKEAEWAIIYQHSLAKITKNLAEQYYAPKSLPPELNQRFTERIENSRNQLIKILREQNDIFRNDKLFVI